MKKKIISILTASSVLVGMIPLAANAIYYAPNDEFMEYIKENSVDATDMDAFRIDCGHDEQGVKYYYSDDYDIYITRDADSLVQYEYVKDNVWFRIDSSAYEVALFDEIHSYDMEDGVENLSTDDLHGISDINIYVKSYAPDGTQQDLTEAEARDIYEIAKKYNCKGYDYYKDYYETTIGGIHPWAWSGYRYDGYYDEIEEEKAIVKEYLEEHKIDAEITDDDETLLFTHSDILSLEEQIAIVNDIYLETGKRVVDIIVNESAEVANGSTIDLCNAVDGDSNESGDLDLADAVLVMQSCADPDEYALTAQGAFNDGITLMDAREIQAKLLEQ